MAYKNIEDNRKNSKKYYYAHKEKINKCSNQYYRDHREKELRRMKQRYLCKGKEELFISKYGLSYNEWKELWYAQDGRCVVCDKFFAETKDICVDHDHKTGKVRSLLCKRCNIGIGLFDDDPKLFENVMEYLKS